MGGVVWVLLRKCFFDFPGGSKNLEARLERAYMNFLLFCQVSHEKPALRGFTKQFFHIKNQSSAPWANSKGSDSLILMRWLRWYLKLNIQRPSVHGFEVLLSTMLQVCEACLELFDLVHGHNLFLDRPCATRMYIVILRFLRGYKLLGQKVLRMFIHAFVLKPKGHSLHHIAHCLRSGLESGSALIMNPEAHACEGNEDYVGRVSRASRRVGAVLVDKRVIRSVFLKTRALHRRRRAT